MVSVFMSNVTNNEKKQIFFSLLVGVFPDKRGEGRGMRLEPTSLYTTGLLILFTPHGGMIIIVRCWGYN